MALGPSLEAIRDQVRHYEAIGLDGVIAHDHLFFSRGGARRESFRGSDPFIRLAIAGAISDRLVLGTGVANIGFQHPAMPLRQFVELASMFGGGRVLAGIGAGWNPEEFDSLGMTFDPLARRIDRLEEASRMFRSVFDTGTADMPAHQPLPPHLPLHPLLHPPP